MKPVDLRTDCEKWFDANERQRKLDILQRYGTTVAEAREHWHDKRLRDIARNHTADREDLDGAEKAVMAIKYRHICK